MRLGSNEVVNSMIGSNEVSSIYLGNNLVWERFSGNIIYESTIDPFGDGSHFCKVTFNGNTDDLIGRLVPTTSPVTFTEGKFDQALLVDSDDTAKYDSVACTGNMSLSIWVNLDMTSTLYRYAFWWGSNFQIHSLYESLLNFTVFGSQLPVTVDPVDWTHIVLMGNYSTGSLALYVNGSLYYSDTLDYFNNAPSNSQIIVGGSISTDIYIPGAYDLFELYDRMLTDEEVLALYNTRPDIKES